VAAVSALPAAVARPFAVSAALPSLRVLQWRQSRLLFAGLLGGYNRGYSGGYGRGYSGGYGRGYGYSSRYYPRYG